MSTSQRSDSPSRVFTPLLLRVRHPDGHLQEVYIAEGLAIGRTIANTVILEDEEAADRQHARIAIDPSGTIELRCLGANRIKTTDDNSVTSLILGNGTCFQIGSTNFECVSGASTPSTKSVDLSNSCPLCEFTPYPPGTAETSTCPNCKAPVLRIAGSGAQAAAWLVPVRYGEYRASRLAGRGGMGLVLKGSHRRGHEAVAIKVLLHKSGESQSMRFAREVDTLSQIQSPHVVRFIEHGHAGRFAYLVMDWMPGGTLQQLAQKSQLENEPLHFEQVVRWFKEACRGLSAIHEAGLIHRDIKPSNLLLDSDGSLRVADFGLAKSIAASQDLALTTTGEMLGTFAYIAPECLHGKDLPDQRSDQFSLGATFYELLTGRRPFGTWEPASSINPSVPPAFDQLLRRLLAPRPDDRFESLAAVLKVTPESLPKVVLTDESANSPMEADGGLPKQETIDETESGEPQSSPWEQTWSEAGTYSWQAFSGWLVWQSIRNGLSGILTNWPGMIIVVFLIFAFVFAKNYVVWKRADRLRRLTRTARGSQRELFRRPWRLYGALCMASIYPLFAMVGIARILFFRGAPASDGFSYIICFLGCLALLLLGFGTVDRWFINPHLNARHRPKLVLIAWLLGIGGLVSVFVVDALSSYFEPAGARTSNRVTQDAPLPPTKPASIAPTSTTSTGHLRISLPLGFSNDSELKQNFPAATLSVSNRVSDIYLIIIEEPKSDFTNPSLPKYFETVLELLAKDSPQREIVWTRDISFNAISARQSEIRVPQEGINIMYLLTTGETSHKFFRVFVWGVASKYEEHRESLQATIKSIQEVRPERTR